MANHLAFQSHSQCTIPNNINNAKMFLSTDMLNWNCQQTLWSPTHTVLAIILYIQPRGLCTCNNVQWMHVLCTKYVYTLTSTTSFKADSFMRIRSHHAGHLVVKNDNILQIALFRQCAHNTVLEISISTISYSSGNSVKNESTL